MVLTFRWHCFSIARNWRLLHSDKSSHSRRQTLLILTHTKSISKYLQKKISGLRQQRTTTAAAQALVELVRFDRQSASFDRQSVHIDRQSERFDRQLERFDRQLVLFDRQQFVRLLT
jgi:hypothetical protein